MGKSPLIHVVSWGELIDRDGDISPFTKWDEPSILRIESPARDFEIVRKLMQSGDRGDGLHTVRWNWLEPPLEGWIASPRLMYRGLCRTLRGLAETAGDNLLSTANVEDICLACDKNATSDRLRGAELPTPESFRPTARAELIINRLKEIHRWNEAYVKLAYGSCASGIAVVKPHYHHPYATTTVTRIDSRFHNTFRVRSILEQDVIDVMNFLIAEHAIAQRGVVKLDLDGHNFDVRAW